VCNTQGSGGQSSERPHPSATPHRCARAHARPYTHPFARKQPLALSALLGSFATHGGGRSRHRCMRHAAARRLPACATPRHRRPWRRRPVRGQRMHAHAALSRSLRCSSRGRAGCLGRLVASMLGGDTLHPRGAPPAMCRCPSRDLLFSGMCLTHSGRGPTSLNQLLTSIRVRQARPDRLRL
jgi:hypothetical protein